MNDVVIRVENLGKLYRIGKREPYSTLRDALARTFSRALSRAYSGRSSGNPGERDQYIWALKGVSFEVRKGEVVGIIGANGAGKSTLLKILSRITDPTEGHAEINGRVGSLLEIGTGFHPELTGHENIYFSGAVLGMKKSEIDRRFDEIVAFAELEKFIDTPVKYYSSGMQVRLGFAIAAHLEPEIMLIDEVLAVGDAAFQKKCLGKIGDVVEEGNTVLFVSHNMGAIRGLCQRAIWLNEGKIAEDGETQRVVSRYLTAVQEGFIQRQPKDGDRVIIERVVLRNSQGEKTLDFTPDDDLIVEVYFRALDRIEKPYFSVTVASRLGWRLFRADMTLDGHRPDYIEGDGMIACKFKSIRLLPQSYVVRIGVRAKDRSKLTGTRDVGFFNVIGRMADFGFAAEIADREAWRSAPVVVPYEWHLPDGRVISVDIKHYDKRGKSDEVGG